LGFSRTKTQRSCFSEKGREKTLVIKRSRWGGLKKGKKGNASWMSPSILLNGGKKGRVRKKKRRTFYEKRSISFGKEIQLKKVGGKRKTLEPKAFWECKSAS